MENGPLMLVIFLTTNLHSVRGFSTAMLDSQRVRKNKTQTAVTKNLPGTLARSPWMSLSWTSTDSWWSRRPCRVSRCAAASPEKRQDVRRNEGNHETYHTFLGGDWILLLNSIRCSLDFRIFAWHVTNTCVCVCGTWGIWNIEYQQSHGSSGLECHCDPSEVAVSGEAAQLRMEIMQIFSGKLT